MSEVIRVPCSQMPVSLLQGFPKSLKFLFQNISKFSAMIVLLKENFKDQPASDSVFLKKGWTDMEHVKKKPKTLFETVLSMVSASFISVLLYHLTGIIPL